MSNEEDDLAIIYLAFIQALAVSVNVYFLTFTYIVSFDSMIVKYIFSMEVVTYWNGL